jgi:putative spermidine/putrescine transport system substrate-binding protein
MPQDHPSAEEDMDQTTRLTSRASRRRFVRNVAVGTVAAVAGPFIAGSARAQAGQRIVMPSYGGSYQDILVGALTEPFTKETGIEVVFSGVPDLARLKAQVMTGRPEWDVFEAGGSWFPAGSQQGLFEQLDKGLIKDADLVLGKGGDYAPFYRWVGVVAHNTTRHKDGKVPRDFKQFWDVQTFPGPRTLRNRADYTLEIALVADGADPKNLYPLDVDRAFKSLGRIKPAITKWAESTSQLVTLLVTGEVDYGFNYNNRIKAAQASGSPVDLSLNQAFIGNEYIGVVKGTQRKDAAMKFVAFTLRPDRQADLANRLSFLPGNQRAMAQMTPEAKKWLPDLNQSNHIWQNDEWWATRTEEVQKKFQEFLLS